MRGEPENRESEVSTLPRDALLFFVLSPPEAARFGFDFDFDVLK